MRVVVLNHEMEVDGRMRRAGEVVLVDGGFDDKHIGRVLVGKPKKEKKPKEDKNG